MSTQQRRTPEVTYTFEGEPGKYVLLEDYTHDVLQWVHLTEALQSRVAELEKEMDTARAQLQEQHAVLMGALKVTDGHWDNHGGQYHCDACNLHYKLLKLKENEHLLIKQDSP